MLWHIYSESFSHLGVAILNRHRFSSPEAENNIFDVFLITFVKSLADLGAKVKGHDHLTMLPHSSASDCLP